MGHDIIVIGTSAGGLRALTTLVGGLPGDLAAAVFIVQHLPRDRPSQLPAILSDVGSLPAMHPIDGEAIRERRIYVAPPDRHLLVNRGVIRLIRGPQENLHRPSIDTLFRTAARAYGPRVVGVVLTGALSDGTVGLQAIKKRGGVAVVQDPDEAEYPSMAVSALRYVEVDQVLGIDQMADYLAAVTREPAPVEQDFPVDHELEIETRITEQEGGSREMLKSVEQIGARTTLTCPSCNGTLWQIGENEPLRFRCHTGHAFTSEALESSQDTELEHSLWSAVRLMEEKATLFRQLAGRSSTPGPQGAGYQERAARIEREACAIRALLLKEEAMAEAGAEEGNGTRGGAEGAGIALPRHRQRRPEDLM